MRLTAAWALINFFKNSKIQIQEADSDSFSSLILILSAEDVVLCDWRALGLGIGSDYNWNFDQCQTDSNPNFRLEETGLNCDTNLSDSPLMTWMALACFKSHTRTVPSSYPTTALLPEDNYKRTFNIYYMKRLKPTPSHPLPSGKTLPLVAWHAGLSKVLQSPDGIFHIHTLPSSVPASSTGAQGCHSNHWGEPREKNISLLFNCNVLNLNTTWTLRLNCGSHS